MNIYKMLCTMGIISATSIMVIAHDTQDTSYIEALLREEPGVAFTIGNPNTANASHFTGDSYFNLYQQGVPAGTVTLVDGAHTHWHQHNTEQILVGESGVGYVQIEGQEPIKIMPGTVVVVPPNTRHWHGAAPHHTFQHISIQKQQEQMKTDWFEPVNDSAYNSLNKQ